MKKSLAVMILCFGMVSGACAQVADERGSGSDDEHYTATLEPRSGPEIMGRLWVTPNPIAFVPGSPQVMVSVFLLAGERIVVEDITIEGSSDYRLHLAGEPGGFIYEEAPCCVAGPCGGGGSLAFPIRYAPSETAPGPANLIVRTADPTSPSFMVPIIVDDEGRYPQPDADDPSAHWEPDYVWVNPDPVRFDALPPGESTTVTMCLGGRGRPETGFGITDISVAGEGLSIAGMRTYEGMDAVDPSGRCIIFPDYLDLTYTSVNGDRVDGLLRISFLDRWETEMTLAVPILVR